MSNIHLKFASKITGESTHKKHKGEIGIGSVSWGVSNASSYSSSTGGGGGKALAHASDVMFHKAMCKASPELMWSCAKGDSVPDATITFTKTVGDSFIDYLVIKLFDVRVSSYSISGSDGGGDSESFGLNFAKIEYIYTTEDSGGIKGSSINKSYNFAQSDAG